MPHSFPVWHQEVALHCIVGLHPAHDTWQDSGGNQNNVKIAVYKGLFGKGYVNVFYTHTHPNSASYRTSQKQKQDWSRRLSDFSHMRNLPGHRGVISTILTTGCVLWDQSSSGQLSGFLFPNPAWQRLFTASRTCHLTLE